MIEKKRSQASSSEKKPKEVKGILIDSKNREVKEVLYKVVNGVNLKAVKEFVGCQTIDICRLQNGDSMYVDDEGLINGTETYFHIPKLFDQPIAGNGLIFSVTPGGSDESYKFTTIDEVKAQIKWEGFELPQPGFEIYTF